MVDRCADLPAVQSGLIEPRLLPECRYSRPALWATIVLAIAVTAGSLGPFNFRVTHGRFLHKHIHLFWRWEVTPHTLMHVLSFGLLGLLASLISERWLVRIAILLGVLLLGLTIECLQYWSQPNNPFEIWDVCSDTMSACVGALIAYAWSLGNPVRRSITS